MKTSVVAIAFAAVYAGLALAQLPQVGENGPVPLAFFSAVSLISLLAVRVRELLRIDPQSRNALAFGALMTFIAGGFAGTRPSWYNILAVTAFWTFMVLWGLVADQRTLPEATTT